VLDQLNELSESHGALKPGRGLITGVIALSLGILCFLGVLAFRFPEYLTTPELRRGYDVEMIRKLLFGALVLSGALSLVNIVFNRSRWLASFAFLLVVLSGLLGGHKVEVDPNFPDHTPYIGLDWFILDLLGSTLIFVFIEKLFALRREQPVFRPEWQTDFHHFFVNHLLVGFTLLATNLPVVRDVFGWARARWRARLHRRAALRGAGLRGDPRRRPRAVHDAPRVPRGALAMAIPLGAPQRAPHGLARRIATAHPRALAHAHPRARADLRARLPAGRDRPLRDHRGLPGRVQPRQRGACASGRCATSS
jgi:hypothetical protein